MEVAAVALEYARAGLAVIPVNPSNKRPLVDEWGGINHVRLTEAEISQKFRGSCSVAIVAGAPSGNLECLDFEIGSFLDEWVPLVRDHLGPEFLAKLPLEKTKSGGYHVLWRCTEPISTTQTLARALEKNPKKNSNLAIETRGAGQYFVCAPSAGYELVNGSLRDIPTITPDERETLLYLAKLLNEVPDSASEPEYKAESVDTPEGLPGTEFNERGSWRDLLESRNWVFVRSRSGKEYYKRPGDTKSIWSATTGNGRSGQDLLHVFSPNAMPFREGGNYSKFGAYALLDHNGDFKAAARALSERGYGKPIVRQIQGEDGETIEFPLTDAGNADRLVSAFGCEIRHCAGWGRWIVWNGKHWAVDETKGSPVTQRALRTVRQLRSEAEAAGDKEMAGYAVKCESRAKLDNMIALARQKEGIAVSPDELDSDPFLLCCKNGTLDLRTGKLRPHMQSDLITKTVPTEYHPNENCPLFMDFLTRIFADNQHLLRFVWKAIGYSLTGATSEHVLFFGHGTGANGKSTLMEVIGAMLGDYAKRTPSEAIMVRQFEGISNDIARLKGARFVTASEVEDGKRLNESLIKSLTGGDTISARFLYAEPFEFRPEFKLWVSGNHKPRIRGTDDGIWRRILLIPFDVTIPPAERDGMLKEKLLLELPGIFAWAVEGCKMWQSEGLGRPAEIEAAIQEYREEMDPLADFLEERTVKDSTARVGAADLWQAFAAWTEKANQFKGDEKRFKAEMIRKGFDWQRTKTGRFYFGVRLIDPTEEPPKQAYWSGND